MARGMITFYVNCERPLTKANSRFHLGVGLLIFLTKLIPNMSKIPEYPRHYEI